MHDFGRLVYLDLHKTGSNFVSDFLRNTLTLPELAFKKHRAIKQDYRSDAAYFITVRCPLDLYSSLYRFGIDGRGAVFKQLKKQGKQEVYRSFDQFMGFVLNPSNANYLEGGYRPEIAQQVGFFSYRYLKLSLQYPMQKIVAALARDEDLSTLKMYFLPELVLKNESLNDELRKLAHHYYPQFFDLLKVDDYLERAEHKNVSLTSAQSVVLRSKELRDTLEQQENLLFDLYR